MAEGTERPQRPSQRGGVRVGAMGGVTGRFLALPTAQKIVLLLLLGSAVYMLVVYTGMFLALVAALAVAAGLAWYGLGRGRTRRIVGMARQHPLVPGICLLALVCSTPILVPAAGSFLAFLFSLVVGVVIVVAAGAAIIGVGYLIIAGFGKVEQERRAREEAHNRWYNSLSPQQKQTYQMERQTRLMEERQRRERYEKAAEAFRQGYRRGSGPPRR